MRPGAGAWTNLLAAGAVAILLPGAVGWSPGRPPTGPERGIAGARFHAGGPAAERPPGPACAGTGCHPASSHRKGGEAAFLNMHEGYVACLACHGAEPEKRWTVVREADRAPRVEYPAEARAGDPHGALGRAAACDRCHSESGKDRLASAGWRDFPQGFVSPIPMRMLLEGGRKWVPDDVR